MGFQVEDSEIKTAIAILNATGDAVDKAHAEGVHVAGERYVVTKIEDRSIYGRQVWTMLNSFTQTDIRVLTVHDISQGRTGIVIVKTKQAILFGHYPETVQAGNATQTVEALADYLIKVGY
jgi:profilin